MADITCRTAEFGLTIIGAADAGYLTVIDATPVTVSDTCPDCAQFGKSLFSSYPRMTHEE